MNAIRSLKKSLSEQSLIGLRLFYDEEHLCVGIVTHLTSEIVAIQLFDDFEISSVSVIALPRIAEARDNARIRCWSKILAHNGQLKKLKPRRWLDKCQSMADVFAQLKQRNIWPDISLVVDKDEWFFTGPLTHTEEEGFLIRNYTASGKWEKEQGYRMEDVAVVEFDHKYGRHFRNYMESLES